MKFGSFFNQDILSSFVKQLNRLILRNLDDRGWNVAKLLTREIGSLVTGALLFCMRLSPNAVSVNNPTIATSVSAVAPDINSVKSNTAPAADAQVHSIRRHASVVL